MARQQDQNGRTPGWRDLALAGAGAAAITLLLVASVALVWLVGRSAGEGPALGAQQPFTPTPRALSFLQETPTAPAAPPTAIPATTAPIAVEVSSPAPDVTATPALLAVTDEPPVAPSEDEALFSASSAEEFTSLASGSWSASGEVLRNEGSNAVAEPWLQLAPAPDANFAIEAEIRVTGLLDSVCDQSFGLVGGNAESGVVYGGGFLFPCDTDASRARLSDVTVWQDGYNADPVVAEEPFDPGEDWRTYRLEMRGDRLRLIVDGDRVVSGTRPVPTDLSLDAQAGLWGQGVSLEVRRVAVYPLPAE